MPPLYIGTSAFTAAGWVVSQPRELSTISKQRRGSDQDWGWTRQAISRLLSSALETQPVRVPFDHRVAVWHILQQLNTEPPFVKEAEATDSLDGDNQLTKWSSTESSEAMQAVVHYAFWVKQNLEVQSKTTSDELEWFERMPEVQALLEEHLASRTKQTVTARSILGKEFPRLVELDRGWISTHLSEIFPDAKEERDLCNSALDFYTPV